MSDCHSTPSARTSVVIAERTATIALAGQPNIGKSTLFNLLTGLNQHVGNWPGKTVEFRQGVFHHHDQDYLLVDLPGTYSLTANSPEEVVAREYILHEQPDLVIAVVSAANLEHSLYLVSELVCLPAPLVIALNMVDVAQGEGIQLEPQVLEAALGVPVVPLIASRAVGVRELLIKVEETLSGATCSVPSRPEIRADHREVLEQVTVQIQDYVPAPYPIDWIAMKLLEGDTEVTAMMQGALPPENLKRLEAILENHDDAMLAIASGRYDWIGRMMRVAVIHPRLGQISITDRLDRWATHPRLGLLVLAGILGIVFWLTFALGTPAQEWMDTQVISRVAGLASAALAGAPAWLSGLIVDGVIGGVGSILTFLPIMVIFFLTFGLLEDIGYMARAAFVMDNFINMMGLHGKSFLPLFLGFGCNVPAVMGTRVIDSAPGRLLTILIAPFIPCMARMGVVAFLAPAFFGPRAALVSWGLILLSLVVLVVTGIVLNRLLFKGEQSAFIMEMPLYHLPSARTIGLLVWHRSRSFLKKAGTIILAFSVIVWALSYFPYGEMQTSFLARLGMLFAPVGAWMGLDWKLTVALLTSFLAKENSIATLGIMFGSTADTGLAATLASIYTPATGVAFLTVSLLFIPCAATVAVIRQETNSWGWTLLNIGVMLLVSVAAGILVFHLATGLGL
ncbi:MAG: ferrous iron transport protein B [Anaerolineae bacterium]|nr:ferrous iron transport protein B [Anaerolineae bacterium]